LPGVTAVSTSYARQETIVTYDPTLANPAQFGTVIEKLGYHVI